MNRNLLAIFFSLFFLTLVTAPTILVFVEDSVDIAFFYDISEEEEEKSNKKNKEFEKFVVDLDTESDNLLTSKASIDLEYSYKTYPKPHLNLISPPPEFI
ncbi:hypothetical protein [uncultured Psychroserpens sp.]|uniref:hypothetical protein n=1 Tax=uncultured Psychroserpens sp. TaxID=255436 RepID=UPI00261B52A2|nr:hypothetical protein [uncultured Psychroserpens sp.]